MDFALTEEQLMFQAAAAEFCRNEVAKVAIELEASHEFPTELTEKMADQGFLGLIIPEEYGGVGADYLSYLLVEGEVAKTSISLSMTLGSQNSLTAIPLMEFGSEAQKRKFLPALASGEKLGCFALTEPGAGSDPAAMITTAKKKGDKWILNGTKIFITTGSVSRIAIVWARTGTRKDGKPELSAFILDREESPYAHGTIEEKMGVHASPTTELVFEDCEVPESGLLGGVGDGLRVALTTLNSGRLSVSTQSLGLATAAYQRALAYSKQREAFGRKISEFQGISFKLADMKVALTVSELLIYNAVWQKQQHGMADPRFISAAAQCKLYVTENATRICSEAVQIFGGYGYMREYRVEEFFRAARLMEILEGSSEIQRLTIARGELKD